MKMVNMVVIKQLGKYKTESGVSLAVAEKTIVEAGNRRCNA